MCVYVYVYGRTRHVRADSRDKIIFKLHHSDRRNFDMQGVCACVYLHVCVYLNMYIIYVIVYSDGERLLEFFSVSSSLSIHTLL